MSKFVILHKKKDTLNHSCCIMKVAKQTLQHLRKKVPLANTIHHSTFLYNQFKKLNLCKSFSNRGIGHLMSILISIFISGYNGKSTDFAQNSSCHRTTIAHFLNSVKCGWYHSFKDKAFVTGSASNWRSVFPPVPFKGKTGLLSSGGCCYAFVQWHCPELCFCTVQ